MLGRALESASARLLGKGAIPGRSFDETDRLVGDGLALPVTWRGDSSLHHEGAPIVFQFRLRQAKLFGLEFY